MTQIDTTSERHSLSFDVIAETLRATNLGLLREGSTVNFERCAATPLHPLCCMLAQL